VLFIKNKILVVMLMLMVFIGQTANATNASCQMDISQNIHLDMDTTNRSAKDMINHIIIIDTATQSFMDDCCIQDCDCALGGGCSSVILLSSPHQDWEVVTLQRKGNYPYLVTRQPLTTLYRPPISL